MRGNCGNLVLAIIAGLFLATLGLILGAVFAEGITANLAAFIVLAVVLFILFFIFLIYRACVCNRINNVE